MKMVVETMLTKPITENNTVGPIMLLDDNTYILLVELSFTAQSFVDQPVTSSLSMTMF